MTFGPKYSKSFNGRAEVRMRVESHFWKLKKKIKNWTAIRARYCYERRLISPIQSDFFGGKKKRTGATQFPAVCRHRPQAHPKSSAHHNNRHLGQPKNAQIGLSLAPSIWPIFKKKLSDSHGDIRSMQISQMQIVLRGSELIRLRSGGHRLTLSHYFPIKAARATQITRPTFLIPFIQLILSVSPDDVNQRPQIPESHRGDLDDIFHLILL